MKNLVKFMLVLVMTSYQSLIAQEKTTLIVEFESIENTTGTLHVGVFEKENFLRKPISGQRIEVKNSSLSIEFKDLVNGEYAISVFQDLNGNGKMDTQSNGMPTEPWAMSGAANPFAPPIWEEVKFTLDNSNKVVKLKI